MLTAVENGGAGRSKMVALGGVGLPWFRGGVAVGSIPLSVRPSSSSLGVLQTVALALRLQNVAAVREPVQRRSREPFAA